MKDREQIKEESINEAMDQLSSAWRQELAESSIVPGSGLAASAHEVAGIIYQRNYEVQACLRIGDKASMKQSLMNAAIAALHCYVSLGKDEESIDF